ncbi:hypothetical protein LY78DRAFT_450556 [Colletotrichum sublineola]|nr:hypothetical protein LY78DRAFT_450556 [Colletotrichum sublineola]
MARLLCYCKLLTAHSISPLHQATRSQHSNTSHVKYSDRHTDSRALALKRCNTIEPQRPQPLLPQWRVGAKSAENGTPRNASDMPTGTLTSKLDNSPRHEAVMAGARAKSDSRMGLCR